MLSIRTTSHSKIQFCRKTEWVKCFICNYCWSGDGLSNSWNTSNWLVKKKNKKLIHRVEPLQGRLGDFLCKKIYKNPIVVSTPSFYPLFVKREYQQLPSVAEHSEMQLQNALDGITTCELVRTIIRNNRTVHHVAQKTSCVGIFTCSKNSILKMDEVRWLSQFLLLERRVVPSL